MATARGSGWFTQVTEFLRRCVGPRRDVASREPADPGRTLVPDPSGPPGPGGRADLTVSPPEERGERPGRVERWRQVLQRWWEGSDSWRDPLDRWWDGVDTGRAPSGPPIERLAADLHRLSAESVRLHADSRMSARAFHLHAAELAYDETLLLACEALGVDTGGATAPLPSIRRLEIEVELTRCGLVW
ncbi:hypothetical protein [Actinopolymorpha pittospori]|uniref:Uncharacterized protein n=1 Tax=Actinopolymorpha pittospori TaxID=648752 RepID=A0A927RD34_9ACTN|nr:hypothetical protein [Actinopolymorpha pittospori]MBE1607725.1 hypothetical protein [Actinopolymorpha pittospori]